MERLSEKIYQNVFVSNFEGDSSGSLIPRQTPNVFYSRAMPTPVAKPSLLAWSDALAAALGIVKPETQEEVDVLAGNNVVPGMLPYAARYGGHQFGNWAGQLGDGRAITLGEWQDAAGRLWEMQLKGAGPTAYSRRADGRAVLRSSVREYLMSEAMHYLGVPTTRALSLVSSGERVLRDMFYNGNPAYEPGAIVMRIAPSFLRFGSFEILAANQELDKLRKLTHWTIERYFPHLQGEDRILHWFQEVVARTASLMIEWLRVGFVHGVMNTDNMSILGLTIDYGPFSFLDDYDPNFTPNTTDLPGRRYAFGRQATVGYWNLAYLEAAIAPLVPDRALLTQILNSYEGIITEKYFAMMAAKLGFDKVAWDDETLITQLEQVLAAIKPDMTIFYQLLIDFPLDLKEEEDQVAHFSKSFYVEPDKKQREALSAVMEAYAKRIKANSISREASQKQMSAHNPYFIIRNYLLHQAIEGLEKGDALLFNQLQEAIKTPYSKNFEVFFAKRPAWASSKAGCSMLSCSS